MTAIEHRMLHCRSLHLLLQTPFDIAERYMIATTLTYVILAASGLIGSAIAWDDLRKATGKSAAK